MTQAQSISAGQENHEARLVRKTRSVCRSYRRELPARMVVKQDKVFLEKMCSDHVDCTILLSDNAKYLSDVIDAYFTLAPEGLPLKILEIALTPRCNFNYPICSSTSSRSTINDLTAEEVAKIVQENFSKEIMLWGLEATEHPDLEGLRQGCAKTRKEFLSFHQWV